MNQSIFAALIHVPKFHNFNVLGLTPIERSLIALEKTSVGVACILTDEAAALRAHLAKNVKDIDLHFFSPTELEAAKKQATERNPQAVFILQEPLVVDISILQDLLKMTDANPNVATANGEVRLLKLVDFQLEGRRSPVTTLPADYRTCMPVRTEEERREVKKRLIRNLTKPSDGWVSRKLNRPISTRISWVLANFPVTPNHVTVVNGLVGFIPAWLMYQGGYWNWLLGGAIIHLTSVVDGVDGELARLKFQHSKFGQSLDTFFDYTTALAALICLTLGVQRSEDWPAFYGQAGVASGIFAVMAIGSLTIYVLRRGTDGAFNNIGYSFKGKDTTFAKVIGFLGVFTKRELYNLIFFIFSILGVMPFTLVYVAIMAFMVMLFAVQANFNLPKK